MMLVGLFGSRFKPTYAIPVLGGLDRSPNPNHALALICALFLFIFGCFRPFDLIKNVRPGRPFAVHVAFAKVLGPNHDRNPSYDHGGSCRRQGGDLRLYLGCLCPLLALQQSPSRKGRDRSGGVLGGYLLLPLLSQDESRIPRSW